MIEFDVNITAKDMYDYNFYHNFRNFNGILGILSGVVCLVLCGMGINYEANISYILMMGFLGLFFTIITPFRIYLKSVSQVKTTPSFRKPLHYEINSKEIVISQDDMKAAFPMEEVWKVADTGKSVIIYTSRVRAYIFPKRELGEKEAKLKEILKASLTPRQYRIK